MVMGFFMAERPEHEQALEVLATLKVDFLKDANCWFAGGTAISLRCGEFRISRDIDFLCSSRPGYRLLRERIHDDGARGLFRQNIALKRDVRADRYGIRFILDVNGAPVKFEIVNESRIDLEGVDDQSLPVARLSDQDLVATKLIANDDRFREESSLARDVIDLIMLEHELGELPAAGWAKARQAYGDSIDKTYYRALQRLRDDSALLQKIFDGLAISEKARIVIRQRLSKNP
jgi:Nucleotidyl transferase AbiEii toxin, Type IV TA system